MTEEKDQGDSPSIENTTPEKSKKKSVKEQAQRLKEAMPPKRPLPYNWQN